MPKRQLDILHLSSKTLYTKYGVDILGLLVNNIKLWDPTQNEKASGRRGLELVTIYIIARSKKDRKSVV